MSCWALQELIVSYEHVCENTPAFQNTHVCENPSCFQEVECSQALTAAAGQLVRNVTIGITNTIHQLYAWNGEESSIIANQLGCMLLT